MFMMDPAEYQRRVLLVGEFSKRIDVVKSIES